MDSEGLVPEAMDEVLTNWDEETRRTRRPRVMLIVPTGQNPSGATMGVERRRKVLEVARKWDVVSRAPQKRFRRVADETRRFLFFSPRSLFATTLSELPRISLARR